MQLAPSHNFTLVVTTGSAGKGKSAKDESPLPVIRTNRPFCHDFDRKFGGFPMSIPVEPVLSEDLILFHRGIKGELSGGLRSTMMCTGKIADIVGLHDAIPDSGPVDIQLLGSLIHHFASQKSWLGADYGCARALCYHQKNMPTLPHFDRLRFHFPGTIIFDEQTGICMPVVQKVGDAWAVTHRSLLENAVPGADLLVHVG
jgi:hypothetical protein